MTPTTPDDVFDLMDSYVTSAALGAAMELGLFWLLAEQPLDVSGVAQALGIPGNRTQYWLQLLNSVGLVDQFSPAEGVAPPSRLYWAFLGSMENLDSAFPTALEIRTRLTDAGFRLLSEHALPQREMRRWSSGWSVVEART